MIQQGQPRVLSSCRAVCGPSLEEVVSLWAMPEISVGETGEEVRFNLCSPLLYC